MRAFDAWKVGKLKIVQSRMISQSRRQFFSIDSVSQDCDITVDLDFPPHDHTELHREDVLSSTNELSPPCQIDANAKKGISKFRVNDLNIQMLSLPLYKQIFNDIEPCSKKLIDAALCELKQHNLPGSLQKMPDVDLQLPQILNGNIEEHFYELGEQQSLPYRNLVDSLVRPIPKIPKSWMFVSGWTKYVEGEKPMPVAYPNEEALIFDVEVCIKDGENPVLATAVSNAAWYCWVSADLYKQSKKFRQNQFYNYTTDEFINLETPARGGNSACKAHLAKPKIVVGHHVAYDRARVKEQYLLERTGLRFLDTMSLHIACCGVTSSQKLALKSGKASYENWSTLTSVNNSLNEVFKFYCGQSLEKEKRQIFVEGNLIDIKNDFHNLVTYCAKDVAATHKVLTKLWPSFLDRFPHPVTLAGILEISTAYLPINSNWRRYVEDAEQTFDDMNSESKFLLAEQANKSCQLFHGEMYKEDLWLWSEDWKSKQIKLKKPKKLTKKQQEEKNSINDAESMSSKLENGKFILRPDFESDDFSCGKLAVLDRYFHELLKTEIQLHKRLPYLAGFPEWYRKLCDSPSSTNWRPRPDRVSTSVKCTPKLLSLTWNYMPLHHVRKHGWCYIVPYKTDIDLPEDEMRIFPLRKYLHHILNLVENGVVKEDIIYTRILEYLHACSKNEELAGVKNVDTYVGITQDLLHILCFFGIVAWDKYIDPSAYGISCGLIKLPHKNGADLNVGNPLSRDFINKFSDSEIACNNAITQRVIEISRQLSYWKNNRDRIVNQIVVWLRSNELPYNLKSNFQYGAILPQVIACGTLTRRAVESTWMTASNADTEKIGSELRSMIQAPPGYSIVGADVDSQELWIAALIGDSYFAKEHGCTAFSWMTLSGQKSEGTDLHSVTAKTMGISRNHAKVINYARIYGAGMAFSERLLQQFVPEISKNDAAKKAQKMFESTKGKKLFRLKDGVLPSEYKREFTRFQAKQMCEAYSKSVDELFEKPKWTGGSESAMFNSLEEIACQKEPKTPFLGSSLSQPICPSSDEDQKLLPTRINWVVQSSAVDFLHLMLVCMRSLIDPKIRFCLSFHDEVRYLVPDKQKYQTALALHVTNLLVRSFFVKKLGMTDLPQSVAFFSSVEVDSVLRKDAETDCVTPSNPHGLSKGYGIPCGESLDICTAIEKAKGKIGILNAANKNTRTSTSASSSAGKFTPSRSSSIRR